MRNFVLLVTFIAVGLSGCSKNAEHPAEKKVKVKTGSASQPAKGPAVAPVQKAQVTAPGMPARAGSQPTSQRARRLPAGHPPTGQASGSQPAGLNGSLSGTIALAGGYASKVKAGSTLFIIVRRDAGDGQKGMLLAAKKIPVTGAKMFPLAYTVTKADIMMQGTVLAGTVRVSARIDQDGDAISKQPGDIVGASAKAHKVGAKGIDFGLDKTL